MHCPEKMNGDVNKLNVSPRNHLSFEVFLTEHCNMACKYCMHFSPLAQPEYLNFDVFRSDLKRLSELSGGVCDDLVLVGGEPLLHGQITRFILEARKLFPVGEIKILTNGLLLPSMPPEFWQACEACGIILKISKYPISFDYEAVRDLADHVTIIINDKSEMNRLPLDLNGTQDGSRNFQHCISANKDHCLKNGRLFTCCIAANIDHFNQYFGTSLQVTELDSIDIYKADSLETIQAFLARSIPFCKYCSVECREYDLPWQPSKKEKSEWIWD